MENLYYFDAQGMFKTVPGAQDEFPEKLYCIASFEELACHFGIDASSGAWAWLAEHGPPNVEITTEVIQLIREWEVPQPSPSRAGSEERLMSHGLKRLIRLQMHPVQTRLFRLQSNRVRIGARL